MASKADKDGREDREKMERVQARKLQELYHGRFSEDESKTMLRHHNWDFDATVAFTMSATSEELRAVLGGNYHSVGAATKDDILRTIAGNKSIPTELRQFSCQDCDHDWWTKVPARKMVSSCNTCHKKMDALPRDKEWGWAVFECQCGNEFRGFGMMGKTRSPCYKCDEICSPVQIDPPERRRGRKSTNTHSCTAPNCFNRSVSGPGVTRADKCVHPKSLTRDAKEFSTPHVSTGSTVNSFLSEDGLMPQDSQYEPNLADIDELPDIRVQVVYSRKE